MAAGRAQGEENGDAPRGGRGGRSEGAVLHDIVVKIAVWVPPAAPPLTAMLPARKWAMQPGHNGERVGS